MNYLCNIAFTDDRPVRDSEREAAAAHFGPVKTDENTPPGTISSSAGKPSSSKARIIPSGS